MSDRRNHRWFPSTTFQTPSPLSTSPIPTSVSSLQAGRTPSYTYPFTPGALHHATLLIPRPMAQEGFGNTMASYPVPLTTLSSSPLSALPAQTRAAPNPVLRSAITVTFRLGLVVFRECSIRTTIGTVFVHISYFPPTLVASLLSCDAPCDV